MKTILLPVLAGALLCVSARPANAYSLNCNTFAGQTTCQGYDPAVGSFTAEDTGLGEVRIRTQAGNTYTCNQFRQCREGY